MVIRYSSNGKGTHRVRRKSHKRVSNGIRRVCYARRHPGTSGPSCYPSRNPPQCPLRNPLPEEEHTEASRSSLPKATPSHGYDCPLSLACARRLNECDLDVTGCGFLAFALMGNKHLTHLSLSRNPVADDGVNLLCEVLMEPSCHLQDLE